MFNSRVRAAFEFLESAVAAAKIHFYGMATWNAFRQGENEQDFLSLAAMESLARDVAGGSHHFRFVQLPCNLGMTEALTRANQPLDERRVPMVEAANKLGITLVASAAMLQGKLSRGLPPFVATALGLQNDAVARVAIRALDTGDYDGAGGDEPRRACARKSLPRSRCPGFKGRIFKII